MYGWMDARQEMTGVCTPFVPRPVPPSSFYIMTARWSDTQTLDDTQTHFENY